MAMLLADLLEVRPDLRQVARQRGLDAPCVLPDLQVVEMQRSELLVDDGARAGRGGLEIQAVVLDRLFTASASVS